MCYDDADGTAGRQRPARNRRAAGPSAASCWRARASRPCPPAPRPSPYAVRHAGADSRPAPGTGGATPTPRPGVDPAGKPRRRPSGSTVGATPSAVPPSAAARPPSAAAPGPQHSLSDPTSPWVIVNKHRPLSPATFVPPDLVRPAVRLATSGEAALLNSTTAAAAERMFAAAAADGVIITLASGYRSFATQRHLRRLREFPGTGGG